MCQELIIKVVQEHTWSFVKDFICTPRLADLSMLRKTGYSMYSHMNICQLSTVLHNCLISNQPSRLKYKNILTMFENAI